MARKNTNILPGYAHTVNEPMPSQRLIETVAAHQDTIILSFSRGKDAIAAWLKLRPHFKRIIPVYYYLIPGLMDFEKKSLEYFEDFFETPIVRVPSTSIYRLLNNYVFQPPERWKLIRDMDLIELSNDELFTEVCIDQGIPTDTFVATGVRAADSQNRRASIYKHGPVTLRRKPPIFHAVWDMKKDELVETISSSGVKLPIDYQWWGRSFDGIDLRFLHPLKQHAPADYEKVLEWFPLADLELFRYEAHLANTGAEYGKQT